MFPATVANLTDDVWLSTNGNRTVLWPAPGSIAPQNDTGVGLLDAALGLPATVDTDLTNATFNALQAAYGACAGNNLAPNCSAALPTKTQRARREARERILAYMAGAQVVPDPLDALGRPKRINAGANQGSTLYQRRDWVLADSTLATPAVVGPPIEPEPTNSGFEAEYLLFRDGFRDATDDSTGDGSRIGFGLRNPDRDKDFPTGTNGPAPGVKPTMTVAYLAANDMLHAFRAGPNCSLPPYTGAGCNERGGEEMWGFVPYDQLDKLRQLLTVQTRANHTYMLAASLRFGDVFVPNPGTASNPSGLTLDITVGTKTESVKGVWRRMLYFGRGIGGKFLTALDVTSPGEYKALSANTVPPVVLWNRGNPDALDTATYAEMGQTWSTPAISFVDRGPHTTTRKASGVDFVLHVGSGYGDTTGCPGATPCEGQTFFTLDALTGDVIAAARIPASAGTPDGGYANALVANATAFNPNEYGFRFLPASDPNSKLGAINPAGRLTASSPEGRARLHRRPPRAALEDPDQRTRHPVARDRPGPRAAHRDRGLDRRLRGALGLRDRGALRLRDERKRPAPGPQLERRGVRARRHPGRPDDRPGSDRRLPAVAGGRSLLVRAGDDPGGERSHRILPGYRPTHGVPQREQSSPRPCLLRRHPLQSPGSGGPPVLASPGALQVQL